MSSKKADSAPNAELNKIKALLTRGLSSNEIAKLTDKQHKHVIVDVETLLAYYQSIYSAEKTAQLIKLDSYKDNSQNLLSHWFNKG